MTVSKQEISKLIRETLIDEASKGNQNWGVACLQLAMKRYNRPGEVNPVTVLQVAVELSTQPDVVAEIQKRNEQILLDHMTDTIKKMEQLKNGEIDLL